MKKIFIIFLILIGLYAVFNFVRDAEWMPFGKSSSQADVTEQTETIEINIASARTNIIPENRVSVEAKLTGKGEVVVERDGDKITVTMKRKWFQWFSFNNKSELKIFIPEDYHNKMAIDIGSGNVNFAGHSKNAPMDLEELKIDISSGNLNIKNITAKHFEQDVSSGNVNVNSLKTESGTFDISSGNLNINHYTGPLKADVSSGQLDVQIDKLTDTIIMDLSSGKINLDLPDNADFTLKGKTSSGKINSDFPLTSKEINSKTIEGTHGSGKHNINLDVSSGSISIF